MKTYPKYLIVLFATICLFTNACGKVEKLTKPLEQAHADFLKKIQTEYQLPDVKLTALDKTIWVFIPFQGPMFEYKASRKTGAEMKPDKKWTVNFLETTYANNHFEINYDIGEQNKYPNDPGYGSSYNEEFNLIYQKATTALRESYMNAATPPEFIVIVIADITRGIKLTYTMKTEDFKYYSMAQLPHEEFIKRLQTDLKGDTNLIEDKEGKSITPTEVTLPEFIARQVTTRVNFKYGQSDFPPSQDITKEILYNVNQAIDSYSFDQFDSIILNNKADDSTQTIPKSDLKNYKDLPLPEGGTIHTIKFF